MATEVKTDAEAAKSALEAALDNATPETNSFWAIRAVALQCYGKLEQNLCATFAELAGINPKAAGIIFFRINNSRARLSIIEALFREKMGSKYNLFRNSLVKQLPSIDGDRNAVVHWTVVDRVTKQADGTLFGSLRLERPTIWESTEDAEPWDYERLRKFANKCLFYSEVIGMFNLMILQRATFARASPGWHDAWLDIFQQAIAYPPPAAHPSNRIREIPGSQPQSSPG